MSKVLTLDAAFRLIRADDTEDLLLWLRRRGHYGYEITRDVADTLRLIVDGPRLITLGESTGVIIPPPPPPVINWQSVPSYDLGSGDFYIRGGAYLKEVYGSSAFNGGYDKAGRLIIEDAYIRSAGPALGGFRGMATLKNVVIEIIPPTGAGQTNPRAIDFQEMRDLKLENVTILSGRGIYCSGRNGQFYGNANAGQGVSLKGVRFRNIDGRRSDGQGGYIRSNWGETHTKTSERIALGGEIGWDVGNALQCHEMPRMNFLMEWCEVLSELGKSRLEDVVNMHGGSGGAINRQAYVRDCLFDVIGGWDWNWQPGQTYNASNRITLNATSGQDVNKTTSSATGGLLADNYRSAYDDNASYTTFQRVITMGSSPTITMQGGHHLTVTECEVYDSPNHWSGTPLSGRYTAYQFSKYANPGGIWGHQTFTDSTLYSGSTSTVLNPPGDILLNGGVAERNRREPTVTDLMPVIVDYRNRAQAAGQQIGSSLPIPA